MFLDVCLLLTIMLLVINICFLCDYIGDLASSDDVAILRGQIEMLRHQLLYERHKRELHAQRNRRLLSRTVKTTALEEQNNAMV